MKYFGCLAFIFILVGIVWAQTGNELGSGAVATSGSGSESAGTKHCYCTRQPYKPVCACSYKQGCKTFYSLCHLYAWNRCRNPDYTLKHRGKCAWNHRAVENTAQPIGV